MRPTAGKSVERRHSRLFARNLSRPNRIAENWRSLNKPGGSTTEFPPPCRRSSVPANLGAARFDRSDGRIMHVAAELPVVGTGEFNRPVCRHNELPFEPILTVPCGETRLMALNHQAGQGNQLSDLSVWNIDGIKDPIVDARMTSAYWKSRKRVASKGIRCLASVRAIGSKGWIGADHVHDSVLRRSP